MGSDSSTVIASRPVANPFNFTKRFFFAETIKPFSIGSSAEQMCCPVKDSTVEAPTRILPATSNMASMFLFWGPIVIVVLTSCKCCVCWSFPCLYSVYTSSGVRATS